MSFIEIDGEPHLNGYAYAGNFIVDGNIAFVGSTGSLAPVIDGQLNYKDDDDETTITASFKSNNTIEGELTETFEGKTYSQEFTAEKE